MSTFVAETIAYIMFALSLTALCMLTFERYMSTLHPVTHRSHLTKRRILVYNCCVAVPVIIFPILILELPSEETYSVVRTATIMMILLFNTFAYARIFLAVVDMYAFLWRKNRR